MYPTRIRPPLQIQQVLDQVVRSQPRLERLQSHTVFQAFSKIAGEKVRQHAQPIRLQKKELTIAVDSASWRQQLLFLAEDLRKKLNEKLGQERVLQIRFTHGSMIPTTAEEQDEEPSVKTLPPPTREEQAQADECARFIQDKDLACIFAQAYLTAQTAKRAVGAPYRHP